MEKITVLMPAYNVEKYIKKTIESVLMQTYENFELIIVDDGSNDNTVSIIKSINDPRITLILNERNMGLPYTRNKLLNLANGSYIALMDADDLCHKKRFEEQIKYLKNNPDIDIVGTRYITFGKKILKVNSVETNPNKMKYRLIFFNSLLNSSVMIRREFLTNNKIKYRDDFKVVQDYAFWIDCSKYGEISNINKVLLKYRTGHDNITKKSKKDNSILRSNLLGILHKEALEQNDILLSDKQIYHLNNVLYDDNKEINKLDLIEFYEILHYIKKSKKDRNLHEVLQYVWLNRIFQGKLSVKEKLSFIFYKRLCRFSKEDIKFIFKSILF